MHSAGIAVKNSRELCSEGVPADISCKKIHLSAPDFTSRAGDTWNSKDTFNDGATVVAYS